MSAQLDYIETEKTQTIEEKFRYLQNKIYSYFKKIQSYDSVLNEFSELKNTLQKIIQNSEESSKIAYQYGVHVDSHHTALALTSERIGRESERTDSKVEDLKKNIDSLREDFNQWKLESLKRNDSLINYVDKVLKEYLSLKSFKDFSSKINLESHFNHLHHSTHQQVAELLSDDVMEIYKELENFKNEQKENLKQFARIQNSIVRLRHDAGVLK